MAADWTLKICEDKDIVSESFDKWYSVILHGAEDFGSTKQIAGTEIRFRCIPQQKKKRHLEFWIGNSSEAAVQLNMPGTVKSENPGTTLALDARGRRYIVRQGILAGNPRSDRIDEAEFRRRTGLTPSSVTVGDKPAKKEWHVVASLAGTGAEIRASTAEFVRLCWNARAFGEDAAEDQARLNKLFGNRERGGWYDVDPALEPTRVLLTQGYVYECLEAVLDGSKIEIKKPRHAANYEVDGTINTPAGPMLLEIKTGVSAADVYCGVGQLTLYPLVLTDLVKHARVLLLPGKPTRHLIEAVKKCGVELHRYELKRGRRSAIATFTVDFLHRCGVDPQLLSDLTARGEALP